MTSSLILNSLEIKNFRAFRHLQIERLGRVNLIVGKNNVGKTSLLEALQLYATAGNQRIIEDLLAGRKEDIYTHQAKLSARDRQVLTIKNLLSGRKPITDELIDPIQIGDFNSNRDLLSLQVSLDPNTVKISSSTSDTHHYIFIAATGLHDQIIRQLWDNIALTNLETDILAALQIIAPFIERINLIGSQRTPIARATNFDDPVPLGSLGEGMNRIFGVVLALVNAKDGFLLIDEIDSGLHYSVQTKLWRLIFEVARRLNVQVFATTHSWDCIEAFQEAAREDEAEGLLISLRRKQPDEDDIVAIIIDESELDVVTREQIEVR